MGGSLGLPCLTLISGGGLDRLFPTAQQNLEKQKQNLRRKFCEQQIARFLRTKRLLKARGVSRSLLSENTEQSYFTRTVFALSVIVFQQVWCHLDQMFCGWCSTKDGQSNGLKRSNGARLLLSGKGSDWDERVSYQKSKAISSENERITKCNDACAGNSHAFLRWDRFAVGQVSDLTLRRHFHQKRSFSVRKQMNTKSCLMTKSTIGTGSALFKKKK